MPRGRVREFLDSAQPSVFQVHPGFVETGYVAWQQGASPKARHAICCVRAADRTPCLATLADDMDGALHQCARKGIPLADYQGQWP